MLASRLKAPAISIRRSSEDFIAAGGRVLFSRGDPPALSPFLYFFIFFSVPFTTKPKAEPNA